MTESREGRRPKESEKLRRMQLAKVSGPAEGEEKKEARSKSLKGKGGTCDQKEEVNMLVIAEVKKVFTQRLEKSIQILGVFAAILK